MTERSKTNISPNSRGKGNKKRRRKRGNKKKIWVGKLRKSVKRNNGVHPSVRLADTLKTKRKRMNYSYCITGAIEENRRHTNAIEKKQVFKKTAPGRKKLKEGKQTLKGPLIWRDRKKGNCRGLENQQQERKI